MGLTRMQKKSFNHELKTMGTLIFSMGLFFLCSGWVNEVLAQESSKAKAKTKAVKLTPAAETEKLSAEQQIDQLIRENKIKEALQLVDQELARRPNNNELLVRRSRLLVISGDQSTNKDQQLNFYEQARAVASQVVASDANFMNGYLRRAVANGKVALFKGVLQARELVFQTRDDAQKAVELNNAGAYSLALGHYILGRTHAKLSETPKALRLPLGLHWGNLKSAEEHFAKAVEVFSDSVSFRTDYGRILAQAGKTKEAKAQLEAALSLPVADPGDPAKKVEAQDLLKSL